VIYGTDTPLMPSMPRVGLKYDAWDFEGTVFVRAVESNPCTSFTSMNSKMNIVCVEWGFSRVFMFNNPILRKIKSC